MMKKHILASILFVFVLGLGTTVTAHPGHTVQDVHQLSPDHYLTDPYHLTVTIVITALLLLAIRAGRKYFGRTKA